MKETPVWLKIQGKKLPGLVLMLAGIAVGVAAQFTLLNSTQDLSEYFIVGHWWENAG